MRENSPYTFQVTTEASKHVEFSNCPNNNSGEPSGNNVGPNCNITSLQVGTTTVVDSANNEADTTSYYAKLENGNLILKLKNGTFEPITINGDGRVFLDVDSGDSNVSADTDGYSILLNGNIEVEARGGEELGFANLNLKGGIFTTGNNSEFRIMDCVIM